MNNMFSPKLKIKVKSLLKIIVGRIGYKIYKFLEYAKGCISEEKSKAIIKRFQSHGYGVKLNGFNWYISSPSHLIVGNNVHLGDNAFLKTEGGLIIGDNTHISRNLTVYTQNHNYDGKRLPYDETTKKRQVIIGKNVWIGMNVSILPGVNIGDGAIIGMGTLVNRNIEPFEIVGLPKAINLKSRDISHYYLLKDSLEIGGSNGEYIDVRKFLPSYLDIPSSKICFVFGTGRSGSEAISENLNMHPDIVAYHEDIKQFIRLSTELAHSKRSFTEVKEEIKNIFKNKIVENDKKAIIHSDQRFWNLIPILKDLFPDAKFIHLIRDGRKTIRSMFAKNWFSEQDFEINKQQWAEYRLNGFLTGAVSEEKWYKEWTAFERCCWYWQHLNRVIYESLKDDKNFYLIKLEEMDDKMPEIFNFLELEKISLEFKRFNSVSKKNKIRYNFEWDINKENAFLEIAGEIQRKFYKG